jgi:hypothetical protein
MALESKPLSNSLEAITPAPVEEKKPDTSFAPNYDFTSAYQVPNRKQNIETNWLYRRRLAESYAEHEDYPFKYNIRYKRLKEVI